MSLNGWYKSLYPGVPSLYQYVNDALQINISKVEKTGMYNGWHFVGNTWVMYDSQDEMADLWNAQYATATPLP